MLKKKIVTCSILVLMLILHVGDCMIIADRTNNNFNDFVTTSGTQFLRNEHPFYFNGFNAYWLMLMASNPSNRPNVTSVFQQANKHGMTVARSWAFGDGGVNPLQSAPGVYNEDMFKGLDFVISEASKYRINMIFSLVNNYPDFGGRHQYVKWAVEQGHKLNSDDDFYTHPVVKGYYKNHVKTILERKNTITGIAYKDDPTIFAWELINEPRCEINLSGRVVQDWIQEMATYLKSIDYKHLLEIGLEGFYGESKVQSNPHTILYGTDFISNNKISEIDFATVHAYADQWFEGTDDATQLKYVRTWLQSHIEDSKEVLGKPLVFAEFGKSSKISGFNLSQRDEFFDMIYNDIYASAKSGGPCNGGIFWQLMGQGMADFYDGYEIVLATNSSTATIIAQQSLKLSKLRTKRVFH